MARRILLLVTDLQIGGTPTVVRELATRLNCPPDVLVDVACLAPRGPVSDQLESAGVRAFPLDARGPTDFSAIIRLGRLVRREGYDTVFSFLVHANVAAAVVKPFFPGVRFVQSIQTTQPNPLWHWTAQAIVQYAAEAIVVPSESVARAAADRSDVPPEQIAIISNAIDPSHFDEVREERPGELFDIRPVPIGFLGRLDPVKRVGDLIDAVALLRGRVHLQIFGQGPERPRLEARIGSLGLGDQITLHGSVPDPRDALRRMALLVLPSEAEGFGLVLIEAMAAGVPVVATDAPGIRNVARNNVTALLVPVGNPRELAGAIEKLLDDSALRERLTAAAFAQVNRRFTWPSVLRDYRQLLGLPSPA